MLGLYPLLPENVEVDRDESGELYYIYHAYTDEVPGEQNKDLYFRRDEIFHVPGLGFNGLIGFSPIAMMKNSLGTIPLLWISMVLPSSKTAHSQWCAGTSRRCERPEPYPG